MRLRRIWMLLVVICLAASVGCKEDPMERARLAQSYEKPDELEAALKEVLAQDPKNFEARRIMTDVHRFRGEYEKTEEALKALWEEKGFGEEKEFPADERAQRDLLENQFNELYAKWADSLDPAKDPEKFEKVVRAGLEWNPKSPTLNNAIVDHFLLRAQALEKEGKKLEAAAAYEEVLQFRALVTQRKEAEAKAATLRKEVFTDAAMKHFEGIKGELQTAEQWNEEAKTVTFVIEADVNKRLKQKNDADLQKARKEAAETLRTTIAQWIAKLTNASPEIAAATTLKKMSSGDESLSRGKYKVRISMVLDDVVDAVYETQLKAEAAKAAAEKQAKEPAKTEDGGEDKPAPDAGGTNDAPADGQTTGKE